MEKEMFNLLIEMNERLKRVEGVVNKIDASKTEDVVGNSKMTKKGLDFDLEYLNNRITELDKRVFKFERQVEN
ncbi:hypothetical protein P4U99_26980 [Brevibacillus agri]|uniref:hypothetical protein n=1 Tax=Brevibacillus agri TaxID=51101 RepID=UPI001EE50935|nr:hypothetical protein [Brevibacillus agri]MCG5252470.1 hypothetical protein [Brevibacillus agri]MED1646757.1 hypothetical protein [Brevibacillus agri]MED1652856.1 hypothetical protein [Brevibacillus agri]MED1690270.1 hypothetical protein [Brevibacillus agri]MED1695399.1 hypothetical protein [Brevibacillus agri]